MKKSDNLHHQADQSYRSPRRERAQHVLSLTRSLLATGDIAAADLVDAVPCLQGGDGAVAVEIERGYSQDVAMTQVGLTGVLVFGSANRPGGGWLNGAKAQEEDISLASSWAEQAALAPEGFYAHKPGLGGMGPDKVLIARGAWLTDTNGVDLRAPRAVVFGGVAAPNLANPQTARQPHNDLVDRLARRLASVLLEWEKRGVQRAVMGAIGCGVFKWKGVDSARSLRLAMNHYQAVGQNKLSVVLAIPDPDLAVAFQSTLKASGPRPR